MDLLIRKDAQSQADKDIRDWGSLTWLASGSLGNAQGVTVGEEDADMMVVYASACREYENV